MLTQPDHRESFLNLGFLLAMKGQPEKAVVALERAVALAPDDIRARMNLGTALASTNDFSAAVKSLRYVIELQPEYDQAHARLAHVLLASGDSRAAAFHFERAIALNSLDGASMLRLAWLLAASSDEGLRNGSRALELAQELHRATGGKDPRVWDTLAAANAEQMNFKEAVSGADHALKILGESHPELVVKIKKRQQLYKSGKPYRDIGKD